jgi:hypothetical protein
MARARTILARGLTIAAPLVGWGCALSGSYDFSGYQLGGAAGDAESDAGAPIDGSGGRVECGTCDAGMCGDGGRCVER